MKIGSYTAFANDTGGYYVTANASLWDSLQVLVSHYRALAQPRPNITNLANDPAWRYVTDNSVSQARVVVTGGQSA